jgi:hypothetical protein
MWCKAAIDADDYLEELDREAARAADPAPVEGDD